MVKPYISFQSEGNVRNGVHVVASLKLIACLVVEIINSSLNFFPMEKPLHVTLHLVQGHQNEQEHNYMTCVSLPSFQV